MCSSLHGRRTSTRCGPKSSGGVTGGDGEKRGVTICAEVGVLLGTCPAKNTEGRGSEKDLWSRAVGVQTEAI